MNRLLGPIIGHVTQTSAKIWVRGGPDPGSKKGVATVAVSRQNEKAFGAKLALLPENDFTAVAEFSNLKPASDYQVTCICPPCEPSSREGTFRTDTEAGNLRFAIGSCRYLFWDNPLQRDGLLGDRIFGSILQQHEKNNLDFMLFLGDQIYADPLNFLWRLRSQAEYFKAYRKAFSQKNFESLASKLPVYMILDDHEIMNNWSADMLPRRAGRYACAMRAYKAYQHSHNPSTEPDDYWFKFYRKGFPFFVLDTRTERLRKIRLLGQRQMNALKDWLSEHKDAPVRFIGTSIAFFPGDRRSDDGWKSFDSQRGEILNFILREKIGPVVFLGGDYHSASVSSMTSSIDPDFSVTSVVSSPLYWPYGYGHRRDFFQKRKLVYSNLDGAPEFEYEVRKFAAEANFVVLDFEGTAARGGIVRVHGRHGAILKEGQLNY